MVFIKKKQSVYSKITFYHPQPSLSKQEKGETATEMDRWGGGSHILTMCLLLQFTNLLSIYFPTGVYRFLIMQSQTRSQDTYRTSYYSSLDSLFCDIKAQSAHVIDVDHIMTWIH